MPCREAEFYERVAADQAQCRLCPHECLVGPGQAGRCGVRRNDAGVLVASAYGVITSLAVDPIEKKPLYHFLPGAPILSAGSFGCNLSCRFCQNAEISQGARGGRAVRAEGLVELALEEPGNAGIAYTYNEPLINYEFVRDCATLARQRGLANVLVSNGYIRPEPFEQLAPLIDAMNLDIKSMADDFYARLCGARVAPVLETARRARAHMHLEITNLVIPGENDGDGDLRGLAQWVSDELGRDTPVHFTRYHPAYRMTTPATPDATLLRARELAAPYLDFVYLGNTMLPGTSDTRCPNCRELVVTRSGFRARPVGLDAAAHCRGCGAGLPFILGPGDGGAAR